MEKKTLGSFIWDVLVFGFLLWSIFRTQPPPTWLTIGVASILVILMFDSLWREPLGVSRLMKQSLGALVICLWPVLIVFVLRNGLGALGPAKLAIFALLYVVLVYLLAKETYSNIRSFRRKKALERRS